MRRVIVVLAFTLGLASGQTSNRTAEERQAILDYKLTMARANQLLAAMPDITRYVVSRPDWQSRMAKSAKMTPAERAASMEQDPKVMAILKQNDLTAKDYLAGILALRYAVWLAAGRTGNPDIIASPANLAFAKANLAQLLPKMDAADGVSSPRK